MNNNDMNIELLKAMLGVWIIQIEALQEKIKILNKKEDQFTIEANLIFKGRLAATEQCLDDLIAIIWE